MTTTAPSPFLGAADTPVALGRALRAMRRNGPVYFDDFLRQWVVLDDADIRAIVQDTEGFDNAAIYGASRIGIPGLVSLTGAEHAAMRQVYTRFFAARAMAGYERDVVRPVAGQLVDELRGRTELELLGDFALRFPIRVMSRLFGLPFELAGRTEELTRPIVAGVLALEGEHQVVAARRAADEFRVLLRPFVENELAAPGDGLLGRIIDGLHRGRGGTVEDCLDAAVSLVIAGYETTNWMLASVLSAFLLNPDALAEVRADRTLLPAAIEEGMRWGNSIIGVNRLVTRPTTVGGVPLDAGAVVLVSFASAHADERVYPDPERFDARRAGKGHLLFSVGPHFCVGAPLARMETRVGIEALLDAFPELRLDPAHRPVFRFGTHGSIGHGPDALHVLCGGQA